MATIFDNPYLIPAAVVIIVVYVCYILLKKPSVKIKEYVTIKFEKTVRDELNEKMKTHGNNLGGLFGSPGHFRLGFNVIGSIDCWMHKKGEFATVYYDKKTKRYEVKEKEKKQYDLLILRAKSNNIFFRILGMKKEFYVLHRDSIASFDEKTKTWATKETEDLIRYGNVWVNSNDSMEWVNNISLKKTMESTMTQVQNFPDRLVHLEVQQAKRNQLLGAQEEANRAKYDKAKKADDTEYG